ncbi:MAG: hypothetical protein ACRCVT_02265 [Leadbetterella sp.]
MKGYIFFILVFATIACSKITTPSKSRKVDDSVKEYSEDLSMFVPKYEVPKATPATEIKPRNPQKKEPESKKQEATPIEIPVLTEQIVIDSKTSEVEKVLSSYIEQNRKLRDRSGVRIQVYVGNNKSDFESIKNYLFRNYSKHEVYEGYTQPTYRIKMGDFLSTEDADQVYRELKSKYPAARILHERINLKKGLDNSTTKTNSKKTK